MMMMMMISSIGLIGCLCAGGRGRVYCRAHSQELKSTPLFMNLGG